MCGIISFIGFNNNIKIDKSLLKKMNNIHYKRGPDYGDEILLNHGCIGLAHRRLSILDLDPRSNQPFSSYNKKHWIVYNGEIYNYLELKNRLESEGIKFRTNCDTEVVLYALITYGEKALHMIEGMFAFVFVDLVKKSVIAARDRVGIKPLAFMIKKDYIAFSSTITPLKLMPGFTGEIDEIAKFEMLTSKSTAAPGSIYMDIRKLLPGELLKININTREIRKKLYWTPGDYIHKNFTYKNENDWFLVLEESIRNAVKRQMISDVPLGTFLSGGIDSSLVTAIMQNISSSRIKSFCVGFKERKYDESVYAEKIAEYLGTEHYRFMVTPGNVIDVLKKITNFYDEPFGDASSIPMFLLSSYARKHIEVALSGDGGDEQFFGYTRYSRIKKIYSISRFFPEFFRRILYKIMQKAPRSKLSHALTALGAYPDKKRLYTHYFHENFAGLSELIGAGSRDLLYQTNIYMRNLSGYKHAGNNLLKGMMLADFLQYMPDDCLVKVDRASMAHSLEVRVPLLDEEVLRVSLNVPLKLKYNRDRKKYLLKKLLNKYIPASFFERPKMGFGVPLDGWLFNELNDYTMDLFSKNSLLKAGFNPDGVSKIIAHHKSGKYDHQYFLWPLCSYMSWFLNSE